MQFASASSRRSLASVFFLSCSALAGRDGIPISELGTLPRTALNDELPKLAKGFPPRRPREDGLLPRRRSECRDARCRGRRVDAVSSTFSPESIYASILEFAWELANAGSNPSYPFLACAHITDELLALLPGVFPWDDEDDIEEEDLMELSTQADGRDDTCFILAISAEVARSIMPAVNLIQPLADIMKIAPGLIDDVMSGGFGNVTDGGRPTGARIVSVRLAPGFEIDAGDCDAELVRIITTVVNEIQAMGVNGGNRRRDGGRPAGATLADAFSITSIGRRDGGQWMADNYRIGFWYRVLGDGLEGPHNCRQVETHVRTGPRPEDGLHRGFDLVLAPEPGGSGPYEACVMSLIVGLSSHPAVLWISSVYPESGERGWEEGEADES